MTWFYCKDCLKKQQRINELEEEVRVLKARLRQQERTAKEGFFGSSTPSSKVPIKPDALPERQAKKGGAKKGHKGNGRKSFSEEEADCVEDVAAIEICPDCGEVLKSKGVRERTVLECKPVEVKKVLYYVERKYCPRCGKTFQGQPQGVLPKSKYGNSLLAHTAVEHYLHCVTLGGVERQTGVNTGSLIEAMNQLARRISSVPEKLIRIYRKSSVIHADETGWRNDGENGYSWLFCTRKISIFRFRKTRSSSVPKEVLGTKKLPGVLVVDRYGAYNKSPCRIQYCYEHLSRDVEDIEKDFPDNDEVSHFVETFKPLLASAMSLRGLKLSKRQYKIQAKQIKSKILSAVNHSARHPAIQRIQDIFREKAARMYHWARDSNVPAENNLAERELRPLVIARKISFGSQSDNGARTREILMTVLHTLRKCGRDPFTVLKSCLDTMAREPNADPFELLFGKIPNFPRD